MTMLALLTAAAGCAPIGSPSLASPEVSAIERGRALSTRVCGGCHAVGAAGASTDPRAPPFHQLAGRYVGVSLQRKLTEISETGHYAMPALSLHSDQTDDIAAYLESLN